MFFFFFPLDISAVSRVSHWLAVFTFIQEESFSVLTLNLGLKQIHASVIWGEVFCEIGEILDSMHTPLCPGGHFAHCGIFGIPCAPVVHLETGWNQRQNTLPYILGVQVRGCDNQDQSHPLLSSI